MIEKIKYEDILDLWSILWPTRTNNTHSNMRYKDTAFPKITELYAATYWGYFDSNTLVGVNSGHSSSLLHYRSRGLYVLPEYRKKGIATQLLQEVIKQGKTENRKLCWSLPRKEAIDAYLSVGFNQDSTWFETETSEQNCYVIKKISP